MPTPVRIDSHSCSVVVWGRERKAICLLLPCHQECASGRGGGRILLTPQYFAVLSSSATSVLEFLVTVPFSLRFVNRELS